MAVYYVKTGGDDLKDGLSEANAWATVDHAASTIVAGDTCYIAPGTYRESVVVDNAGSSGNIIQFIGDPNCERFTNENPGYVRITGCDVNELPGGAGPIIDSRQDYVTWKNVIGDGTLGFHPAFYFDAETERNAENCIGIGSAFGFMRGNQTNCIGVGGQHGFFGGTQNQCLGLGGENAFESGTNNKCIGLGSYHAFNGGTYNNCIGFGAYTFSGTSNNCIGIGGYYIFYGGTQHNCIALGGYSAFYAGTANRCIALGSYYGFNLATLQTDYSAWQASHAYSLNDIVVPTTRNGHKYKCTVAGTSGGGEPVWPTGAGDTVVDNEVTWTEDGADSNCKAVYCRYNVSGGTGVPLAGHHIGWTSLTPLLQIAKALKPDLFFEKDYGDNSVLAAVTEDILGDPRRQNDGTIDIGAFEYADRELDWANYQTNPPGIKINRKGCETFFLPAKGGQAVTITVQVKFNSVANKPSLKASGASIATQTDTATTDGSAWEELTVSFTPSFDDRIEVRLLANDTTAAKYSIFSDIKVS